MTYMTYLCRDGIAPELRKNTGPGRVARGAGARFSFWLNNSLDIRLF
jgi:hypothetical protein